jgi:hypothetical protein
MTLVSCLTLDLLAKLIQAVVDLPIQTLILSAFGAFFLARALYSLLRLAAELTLLSGTNVSYNPDKHRTA